MRYIIRHAWNSFDSWKCECVLKHHYLSEASLTLHACLSTHLPAFPHNQHTPLYTVSICVVQYTSVTLNLPLYGIINLVPRYSDRVP